MQIVYAKRFLSKVLANLFGEGENINEITNNNNNKSANNNNNNEVDDLREIPHLRPLFVCKLRRVIFVFGWSFLLFCYQRLEAAQRNLKPFTIFTYRILIDFRCLIVFIFCLWEFSFCCVHYDANFSCLACLHDSNWLEALNWREFVNSVQRYNCNPILIWHINRQHWLIDRWNMLFRLDDFFLEFAEHTPQIREIWNRGRERQTTQSEENEG